MDVGDVCIKRFADIPAAHRAMTHAGIDAIFFGTSFQSNFADANEQAAFRHLWVGQYLTDYPDLCFVALRADVVVGYLAGYLPLPGRTNGFPGQHHMPVFADLQQAYPAHLHINIRERERSLGTGGRLVDAFVALCVTHDVAGVHVVAAHGGRNNAFYRRLGFDYEVRRATADRDMIFMGRVLR